MNVRALFQAGNDFADSAVSNIAIEVHASSNNVISQPVWKLTDCTTQNTFTITQLYTVSQIQML
jgi:hypothetical protein